MIGTLCKYTPIELFYGFHETPLLLTPLPGEEQTASLHPNLCSYAKAVCSVAQKEKIKKIVFTNCCDSIKRVSDVLGEEIDFCVMLSLPRVTSAAAADLFAAELLRFIREYEASYAVRFDPAAFRQALAAAEPDRAESTDHIALIGARLPGHLLDSLRSRSPLPVRDLTCTGQTRFLGRPPETDDLSALIKWYAPALLSQPPCMRMQDVERRRDFWQGSHTRGIVYHTIKFCDYYGFEYAALKNETSLPVLKLETDYTGAADGQLSTRMEAFFESLGTKKADTLPPDNIKPATGSKLFAGVDSGSTSTDAVILDENLHILATSILPTGGRSLDGANAALENALAQIGAKKEDLTGIVATGYGRNTIHMGRPVTEITCHAKGAYFLDPSVRTIIDIGGQDSKIIKLDDSGDIIDFSMNDKCAAGTGRFLEMMSNTLGMQLDDFALTGLKWEEDIHISSMCSVFAESEVISLIAQNKKKPDIIHGINNSITTRIHAMITRLACQPKYMMTGGVAKNKGVVLALCKKLGEDIILPDHPQLCGALGAALIATGK